ncbi:MAG: hypothetical protein R2941_24745 [Desulfobacterales bacterium]
MARYEIRKNDDPIRSKMAEIDTHVSGCVYVNKNKSFLKKLFPDRNQRELAEHELRLSQTEFQFRENALRIARNAQLQAIEEMYNDYLVRGKVPIRRERAAFVAEQRNILETHLQNLSEEFEISMMISYKKAEQISIPSMKDRKLEMLDNTITDYYDLIRQLKENFRQILDESVES